MLKKLLLCLIVFMPLSANAGIISILRMIENYSHYALDAQRGILQGQIRLVGIQSDILKSQQNIEDLMRDVNADLTGHAGWGTYQSQDYQSYGNAAGNWSDVLAMAERGHGSGVIGQKMSGAVNQFPSSNQVYNRGIASPTHQKYYAVKSQNVVATRVISEVEYNKIEQQIAYQQMLQQQIEKTKNLKSAVDLSNRLQVEANLIGLQLLRQTSIHNQQQAISEQEQINSALQHSKFLTK